MCGLSVSSTQVSNLTAELDETFELRRNQKLPEIAHMIIDATYIKVRIVGCVRDSAVLTAIEVRREDGKRRSWVSPPPSPKLPSKKIEFPICNKLI